MPSASVSSHVSVFDAQYVPASKQRPTAEHDSPRVGVFTHIPAALSQR
jgi:hypothetical protein